MDEVIHSLYLAHGCGESFRLQHVARGQLHLIKPSPSLQPRRVTHQAPHPVTGGEQARDEPPAHITRGASDQNEF